MEGVCEEKREWKVERKYMKERRVESRKKVKKRMYIIESRVE